MLFVSPGNKILEDIFPPKSFKSKNHFPSFIISLVLTAKFSHRNILVPSCLNIYMTFKEFLFGQELLHKSNELRPLVTLENKKMISHFVSVLILCMNIRYLGDEEEEENIESFDHSINIISDGLFSLHVSHLTFVRENRGSNLKPIGNRWSSL